MKGDIRCRSTQCRKRPIAGQSSGAERGHMRVVRPVWDRGELWSLPTPSPGRLQKQEIQNSRKDSLFYQIPACNPAPSEQAMGRRRRKASAKWGQCRVRERHKQNADTDTCFGIWKEFGEADENELAWNRCTVPPELSAALCEREHRRLICSLLSNHFISVRDSSRDSNTACMESTIVTVPDTNVSTLLLANTVDTTL